MGKTKPLKTKARWLSLFGALTASFLFVFFTNILSVSAQELLNRSVSVSSGLPAVATSHSFSLTPSSVAPIGSIVFEYCENAPVVDFPCNAPVGLDASVASLATQSGNTGFSFDNVNSTANRIVITRTPSVGIPTPSNYLFNNITNPSNAPHSEFVRISTHATSNGSGPIIDKGSVAFAINAPLNVAAYIPPFLNFCVGITVEMDCSGTYGDSINLGIISRTTANSATSQFSTATNDPTGYVVSVLGNTMTSGNNIIPALGAPFPSLPGVSQFGINLRDNSNPNIGSDPSGIGPAYPAADYNFINFYKFVDGDTLATSIRSSYYARMTVSYLVNASSAQEPGTYSATLTYVATVQF